MICDIISSTKMSIHLLSDLQLHVRAIDASVLMPNVPGVLLFIGLTWINGSLYVNLGLK